MGELILSSHYNHNILILFCFIMTSSSCFSPQMANKMGELVGETEQRDAMVAKLHEEAQLQIVLLQHQVGKWTWQSIIVCDIY